MQIYCKYICARIEMCNIFDLSEVCTYRLYGQFFALRKPFRINFKHSEVGLTKIR